MCVLCPHVCICTNCVPAEIKRRLQSPRTWNYTWLWSSKRMLGVEPRSSTRTASALICWTIFPTIYFQLDVCTYSSFLWINIVVLTVSIHLNLHTFCFAFLICISIIVFIYLSGIIFKTNFIFGIVFFFWKPMNPLFGMKWHIICNQSPHFI